MPRMDKERRFSDKPGEKDMQELNAGGTTGHTWNQGQLAHLIPTASSDRFLIKASFMSPLTATPRLSVDGRPIDGEKTDRCGRFWRFDAANLQPATQYELQVTDPGGAPLCDAWQLKTFPAAN